MRMKGTKFSRDESAAYRNSLSFVYDRALEVADSPKGKMKILQSSSNFWGAFQKIVRFG
ncbi:MAG: hypothetical protein M2R45_01233 [Verrucomicrobia subdivision 3 bacterium]|nr:hypothetical protein [Limisphaerales bacterium]MCS1415215.1 hypothetical protein [Limisphaerales bacterium]